MKQIRKKQPLEEFSRWPRQNPGANWDEFSLPENRRTKDILAAQLHTEQGNICYYCEQRISQGKNSHIEHFRPRGRFPGLIFDYKNLFASCNGNVSNPKQNFCGRKKRGHYRDDLVSPLLSECESRFIYTAYGQILPRDEHDAAAKETIEILGLNSRKLQELRRIVHTTVSAIKDSTPELFAAYIKSELGTDDRRNFCQFWTAVKYYSEVVP